jgi:hypothetical protein
METGVLPLIEASDPSPPLRFLDQRRSWSKSRQKRTPGALQSSGLCDEANPARPLFMSHTSESTGTTGPKRKLITRAAQETQIAARSL